MFGAVFKATLKVGVVGKATRSLLSKKDIFEVEKIGVYMRDTYDFNANKMTDTFAGLGVWNKKRLLSKSETAEYRTNDFSGPTGWMANFIKYRDFVPVHNSDFRAWQKKHNEGGDFFVFSDVLWLKPNVEKIEL